MRTLGLALYAEGRTDYYFLLPLLQRLCEDICLREARVDVDVSAVLGLDHPAALNEASREDRITEAARLARESWNILFIHADGAGDIGVGPLPDGDIKAHLLGSAPHMRFIVMGLVLLLVLRFAPRGLVPEK